MTQMWKWRSRWLSVILLSLLVAGIILTPTWNWSNGAISIAAVFAEDEGSQPDAREPIQVAYLKAASDTLPNLVFAVGPDRVSPDASSQLKEADLLRESSSVGDACREYILLVDEFPNTPQAKAAEERLAFLLGGRTDSEMDAIEANLPSPDDLNHVDGLTSLGHFYFKRAQDLVESNPEAAGGYLHRIYDMGWPVFEDELDDDYKSTLLMGYLVAADALGKGDEARAALSAHADAIPGTFTSWVIKVMVDGEEPPFEFVTTADGRDSVREYYWGRAREAADRSAATAYWTKVRDVSWQMLINQAPDVPAFGHARYFLEGSNGLGMAGREQGVADLTSWIKGEPMSVQRWVARYELAEFLIKTEPNGREARLAFQQFEAMVEEAEAGIIESAINDTSIDENTRGLLVCVWGHAYAGTNNIEDAEVCYDWVLDYFTNETHAGASAAFALAQMEQRKHPEDPAVGAAALEAFARNHPGNLYSAEALMDVANMYVRADDTAMALQTYEQIEREYWDTSMGEKARLRREEVSLQTME